MSQMTERLIVGGSALVVGLLLGWVGHGVAGYNTATETVTAFQDWRTACPAASITTQYCAIIQDILDSKTRNAVARIAIVHSAKDKALVQFTMPLGVALAPGMGLSFGTDAPTSIPYRICTNAGCIAEIALDPKLQASLDAGKDGKMILSTGPRGKDIPIPLSLKGLGAAQNAYRSSEAKRSSWFWRMW